MLGSWGYFWWTNEPSGSTQYSWFGLTSSHFWVSDAPALQPAGDRLARVDRVDRTMQLLNADIEIEDILNARNTATCTFFDNTETWTPLIGHEVELLHGVALWPSGNWAQIGLGSFNGDGVNNGILDVKAFDLNTSGIGSQLILGASTPMAFRSVRLYATGLYKATWSIEHSDDGLAWTVVAQGWNSGQDGAYSTRTWADAGTHLYWRLVKSDAGAAGGDICEVQFSTQPLPVLFHGTIQDMAQRRIRETGQRRFEMELVDWNQLLDRRLIAWEYVNQSSGAIIEHVIDNYLVDDGIVASSFVEVGPLISKFVSNYLSARQLLDDLSELIGYGYYVDYDKRLHWFPMESNLAPFTLDNTTALFAGLSRRDSRSQYRNVQYVRAGKDLTDPQTENFKGDGSKRTWNVGYPIAQAPSSVTVNFLTPKTIGIRGVDSNKQYYWNKGTTEITQDISEPLLSTTDVLTVVYIGLYDVIVAAKRDTLVTERQDIEGGSGLYEQLENFTTLDGQDLALDKARGLLKKFGRIPATLDAETDLPGLQAGMLLPVDLPALNLSGNWLIESVRITNLGRTLRYSIRAVDGEHLGGWIEFWKKFYESDRQFVARENEVINTLIPLEDGMHCTDSVTAMLAAGDTGEWGPGEFGEAEFG